MRGKKQNSLKEYTRVSENFIDEKDNRYYVVCEHRNTAYEDINTFFSVDQKTINKESKNNLDIDKVFLFQFFNFVLKDGSQEIEYYNNNEKKSIDVNKFIDKVK
jgi:hypothetical protein